MRRFFQSLPCDRRDVRSGKAAPVTLKAGVWIDNITSFAIIAFARMTGSTPEIAFQPTSTSAHVAGTASSASMTAALPMSFACFART